MAELCKDLKAGKNEPVIFSYSKELWIRAMLPASCLPDLRNWSFTGLHQPAPGSSHANWASSTVLHLMELLMSFQPGFLFLVPVLSLPPITSPHLTWSTHTCSSSPCTTHHRSAVLTITNHPIKARQPLSWMQIADLLHL